MSANSHLDSVAAMDRLLAALSEQLSHTGHEYDLIVIGGSALLALGLVSRATQDVDIVALTGSEGLAEALPLPAPLTEARARVARDFDLPEDWLNSESAADMLRLGLPEGLPIDWYAAITAPFSRYVSHRGSIRSISNCTRRSTAEVGSTSPISSRSSRATANC